VLRRRTDVQSPLDLSAILRVNPAAQSVRSAVRRRPAASADGPIARTRLDASGPVVITGRIRNTDRAFGADIAGAIAAQHGDAGMPAGSVTMNMTGSAGQSFGAFALPGMRLSLIGDANDGLGKGMHGGEIVLAPSARERGRSQQVLAGNAALYGATGGRVFIAGRAGERFAVRNSGAVAVVEGVGDHGCEYMTGGVVVVLGGVGRNFASGMTGGVAFVCDRRQTLIDRVNPEHLALQPLTVAERKAVRELIEAHERATGSRLARAILRNDRELTTFKRVAARGMIAGLGEQACTSALEKSTSSSSTPQENWPESAALAV
jgi:glutamate synthase domain-containing protein 3